MLRPISYLTLEELHSNAWKRIKWGMTELFVSVAISSDERQTIKQTTTMHRCNEHTRRDMNQARKKEPDQIVNSAHEGERRKECTAFIYNCF
mmetsp:Transcript_36597/g.56232  ORF Transcript_36597/g.56232 Transcript_36597/m.56232 type:complete len:92 (-) Transcript_36597:61-336(-)